VYREITEEVIDAYWRDYEDHKADFMPAFLANDILRLWRTFCVNYEARTSRDPDDQKARGKVKNYKLKHSRLLTCFSALLYLLAIYGAEKAVHPENALTMIGLSPTQRLEWLLERQDLAKAHDAIRELLDQYEHFLEANTDEDELVLRFMDKKTSRSYMSSAYRFGDLVTRR